MNYSKYTSKQTFNRYLSYVSHEIRSPVSSIMTLCEVLDAGVYGTVSPRQQQAFGELREYGQNLLALLENLIALAKAKQGKLGLNLETVVLEELLQMLEYLTHESLIKKRQFLHKRMDSTVQSFTADSTYLKNILLLMLEQTIIQNAPGVELELRITQHNARLGFHLKPTTLQTSLTAQPSEHFTQVYLPLAHTLAQLQGGALDYDADTGSFNLWLPFHPIAAQTSNTTHASAQIKAADYCANREQLIVIAESDPVHNHALADFLLAQGYRVKSIFNGAEAVIHCLNLQPNLLIMDVHLPDLDGFSAAQQLQTNIETQQIAILLMSTQNTDLDSERAQRCGALELLHKPFSLSRLQSYLAKTIAHK